MIKSWPKYILAKNDNGHKKQWPKMNMAKGMAKIKLAKIMAWPNL